MGDQEPRSRQSRSTHPDANQSRQPDRAGSAGQQATPENAQWATQEEYEERVPRETETVVVPVADLKFRIQKMEPKRFGSLVEEYQIRDLHENLGDLQEQADINRDPDQIGGDEDEVEEVVSLIAFLKDVVVPNVVKPEVYWASAPEGRDPSEMFDVSTMHDDDLMYLVGKITGQDSDQMAAAAEDQPQYAGNR